MGSERTLHLRRWVALLLVAVSLLPGAALGAPHAARVGPDVPRPPKPGSQAPDATTDGFGTPLGDWLAVVPDNQLMRTYLVYGDLAAWYDETNIDPPTSLDELEALPADLRELAAVDVTLHVVPPPALGAEYVREDDQEARVGFGFFNTEQFLWSMGLRSDLALLRVQGDADSIGARLLEAGYSAQSFPGGVLFFKRGDNETDLQAKQRTDQLGRHNRIAVVRRAEGADLLVARATGVITPAIAALSGEGETLADDMGYRTLASAVDYADLVPGALVGLTILGGERQFTNPVNATPEQLASFERLLVDYAEEPLPPYRMAAFGTSRDGDETYLTLYLVLAPGGDANSTATILYERLDDYTLSTGQPLSEWVEFHERGAYINELEIAYVTMRVLPEAARGLAWSRLIDTGDLTFLVPGE